MLSNACKYAIRAIIYLAIHSDEKTKIGVKTVAEDLEVPQAFLAKLLQQLGRNELVSSTKGPSGGFYLNEKNQATRIWDVIKCIDGPDKFGQCFLGLSKCDDKNPCPAHFIVAAFKQKLLKDFKEKNIAQYTAQMERKEQVISLKNFDPLND